MPRQCLRWCIVSLCLLVSALTSSPTALDEGVQALLDHQTRVEDDQAVAERQHIVARAHFEKSANRSLYRPAPCQRVVYEADHDRKKSPLTNPSICSYSIIISDAVMATF